MRPLRWTNIAVAVALVLGIPTLLLYNGFCISASWRDGVWHHHVGFLSDQRAINAAIDEAMTRSVHAAETPTGGYTHFSRKNQIAYRSRDEFLLLNPDCCKIVPHDDIYLSWWHRVFGLAAKSVRVTYTVRYLNEDGRQSSEPAVAQPVITNCGRVARFD
jgi:hypothetical protein